MSDLVDAEAEPFMVVHSYATLSISQLISNCDISALCFFVTVASDVAAAEPMLWLRELKYRFMPD